MFKQDAQTGIDVGIYTRHFEKKRSHLLNREDIIFRNQEGGDDLVV